MSAGDPAVLALDPATSVGRSATGLPSGDRWRGEIVALVGLALVGGAYFIVRAGGQWSEADSGLMSQAIRDVVATARLAPETVGVYGNGYGYQVVSATILAFTGLDVLALQQLAYPILSAALVLPAWALYRELTGSGRIASLAVLILLLVPEHLFAVMRGSHERLDRAFLLTAVWLLVRCVRVRGNPTQLAVHVALLLLAAWGLIATNALFGMSFVAATGTGFVISFLALSRPSAVRGVAVDSTRLLGWATLAMGALVVVFVGIYAPIGPTLSQLAAIPGRLLEILAGGISFDPYAGVVGAWVSPAVYLLVSATDFVVLGASALIWLWLGWSWLRGARPSFGIWILWLLYAGFAAQEVASIVADRTGALGSNAQYRMFAVFVTFATPLVAVAVSRWRPRPWLLVAAALVVLLATSTAVLKSTLDPAVSNRWIYYTTAELEALRWTDTHQRATTTWVGLDDRLTAAYAMVVGYPTAGNGWDIEVPEPATRSFLVSDADRLQEGRLGASLLGLGDSDVVYDNGEVQLYRTTTSVTLRR